MQFRPVLSSDEARTLDQLTISTYVLPEDLLMENAGLSIANYLKTTQAKKFLFLVGFGNNGGDALVAIRHLTLSDSSLDISFIELNPDSSNPLYQLNRKRLQSLLNRQQIKFLSQIPDSFSGCIVDGLFGSGLNRDVNESVQTLINWSNQQNDALRIAIDVPSGLDATTGLVHPICFQAHTTLTIGFKKQGFFFGKGPEFTGEIEVLPIGFDQQLLALTTFEFVETSHEEKKEYPISRKHKYDEGFVTIIAGSQGLTGAAYLSAQAAVESGAAAVQLLFPAGLEPIYDILLPEVIKKPIGDKSDLWFNENHIGQVETVINFSKKQVVVVGPGTGNHQSTQVFLKSIIENCSHPMIIDADALAVLSQITKSFDQPVILTPHIGELKRILSQNFEFDFERLDLCRTIATEKKVFVFSKGTYGFLVTPEMKSYLLPFDNHKFRKTGFGDVFSGWLAGSLTQNSNPIEAFYLTAFELHQKAKKFTIKELTAEKLISK